MEMISRVLYVVHNRTSSLLGCSLRQVTARGCCPGKPAQVARPALASPVLKYHTPFQVKTATLVGPKFRNQWCSRVVRKS